MKHLVEGEGGPTFDLELVDDGVCHPLGHAEPEAAGDQCDSCTVNACVSSQMIEAERAMHLGIPKELPLQGIVAKPMRAKQQERHHLEVLHAEPHGYRRAAPKSFNRLSPAGLSGLLVWAALLETLVRGPPNWRYKMATSEAQLMEARAVRYYDAARVLHQHTTTDIQSYWEPFNFLLSMAAELSLKAFLMGTSVPVGQLKSQAVRHSLSGLLGLAIENGLRTSQAAVEPILHMHKAHAEHSFRYTGNLAPDKVRVIFHAKPEPAILGIGELLDHASPNPFKLRSHTASGAEWTVALPAIRPVTAEELRLWIVEIDSYQKAIAKAGGAD